MTVFNYKFGGLTTVMTASDYYITIFPDGYLSYAGTQGAYGPSLTSAAMQARLQFMHTGGLDYQYDQILVLGREIDYAN